MWSAFDTVDDHRSIGLDGYNLRKSGERERERTPLDGVAMEIVQEMKGLSLNVIQLEKLTERQED